MRLFIAAISFCIYSFSYAQQGIVSGGADNSSSTGSVSYSIGQIDYGNPTSSQGTSFEGLQVPYEIYVVVGIDEPAVDLSIKVYPNPTDSRLFLSVSDFSECRYQLYSINGALLSESELTDATTEIDLEEYAATSFILRVHRVQEEIKSFKIIKR